jgi:hypothetical protein
MIPIIIAKRREENMIEGDKLKLNASSEND